MASEQARRDNKVTEREVKVEKDRVPKMTSHFESMAEKSKDSDTQRQQTESGGGGTHFVSLSEKGSNMPVSDEGEGETKMKRTQMPQSVGKFVTSSDSGPEKKKDEKASLEDIHGYRANAQQQSMNTIRAAEERYNKAKEGLSHGGQEARGEEMEGKGRDSGVHVAQFKTVGGDQGGAAVFGREARGKGGEDRESDVHGFHGEKARHAQLLAAGGEEMRERKSQESVGGVGSRSATDTVAQKGRQAKESIGQGASEKSQRASDYVTEKGRETGQAAAQKGQEAKEQAARAKDTAAEKARKGSEYATEKGKEAGYMTAEQAARAKDYTLQKAVEAKDIAAEKAQRASQYVTEKGKETGNTAVEQAARAKDYTMQKAVEAKNIAAEKAQRASEYATEKGNVAAQKGQEAASMTAKAKDYTLQKAGEAAGYIKETTVEGGKGAAHYAGVAAEKAAEVGWTAAHFTTEKVVQGTKAVAGTVEGAVGYAGHKAVEVGSKAVDLTKEKAAVAADTVVGYTARKKEEAQHIDQEMHQGGEEEKQPEFYTEERRGFGEEYRGSGAKGMAGEERRDVGEEEEEYGRGRGSEKDVFGYGGEARRDVGEEYRGGRYVEEEGVGAGGVLGAIGETIAEIAQTTKNIVIGDEPVMTRDHGTTAPEYTRQEHGHR